jgi:fimbrial chaperone protein
MNCNTQGKRPAAALAGALLATLAALPAAAGTFSVSPVRIYMQPRERATAVTIVNEGDTDLVMQADLFQWKQKADGSDDLVPTEDLILAPPILKLAPKSRQVLRLANLRPAPTDVQQTYRMVVREIPEAKPTDGTVQVQVALAFSLPVFITPQGARSKLECQARKTSATTAVATCENRGQAYAQAVTMTLTSATGDTLATREISAGYVLPQVRRSFEVSRTAGPLPPGPVKLIVTQDDGSKQTFDVQMAE